MKIINNYQDWLISTISNLEAEDSTRNNCNMNTRDKCFADGPEHPSGFDLPFSVCEETGFYKYDIQHGLYGKTLQAVLQHFCNLYCKIGHK